MRTWPYLADRGVSECRADLERMLDDCPPDAADTVQAAIDALDAVRALASYRDGFYVWNDDADG